MTFLYFTSLQYKSEILNLKFKRAEIVLKYMYACVNLYNNFCHHFTEIRTNIVQQFYEKVQGLFDRERKARFLGNDCRW